jgi:hypothetical protein
MAAVVYIPTCYTFSLSHFVSLISFFVVFLFSREDKTRYAQLVIRIGTRRTNFVIEEEKGKTVPLFSIQLNSQPIQVISPPSPKFVV